MTDPNQTTLTMPEAETPAVEHRRKEVKQAVSNACDQMRGEGVHPRDYVEQLSWLFFLKAFEELEDRQEEEAAFSGDDYERRLTGEYRWSAWTAKRDKPKEMLAFVQAELFPHLLDLGEDPLAQRFRRVFSSVRNHQSQAANFAHVVTQVDRLHFSDRTDVVVLSEIYERLLKDVAETSGYAGEFYTPRHIVRAMVEAVRPTLGERIYDPCFGSAGFLTETADYLRRKNPEMSADELEAFQHETFIGREMVPLAFLSGTMNLILHGVQGARLELTNTLEVHQDNVPESARQPVILANPPYGGKMASVLTNFVFQSRSTEVLFMQHIAENLAHGGRSAIVVPEGFLFRGGPDQRVRRHLLEHFDVRAVLSLPPGAFYPYTAVKTNILFIDRPKDGRTTDEVWFYELTNDGYELKTTRQPMEGDQFPDFLAKLAERPSEDEEGRCWRVPLAEIAEKGWDLTARNPNHEGDYDHRPALELVQSIRTKEERIGALLGELEDLLEGTE